MLMEKFGRRGALARMLGIGAGAAAVGSGMVDMRLSGPTLPRVFRAGTVGIAGAGVDGSGGERFAQSADVGRDVANKPMSAAAQAFWDKRRDLNARRQAKEVFRRHTDGLDADIAAFRLPRASKVRMQMARDEQECSMLDDLMKRAREMLG